MSRSGLTKHRRGVDIAVGAALVAAMIALAHEAKADTDLDPFEDLFGDSGFNSWTPSADSFVASIDPTGNLAGNLDTSVDNFQVGMGFAGVGGPFTFLVTNFDPSAFSFGDYSEVPIPLDATGDAAVGSDYLLSLVGLATPLGDLTSGLDEFVVGAPVALFSLVFWGGLDLLTHLTGVG
jgi:hypothetical protein